MVSYKTNVNLETVLTDTINNNGITILRINTNQPIAPQMLAVSAQKFDIHNLLSNSI